MYIYSLICTVPVTTGKCYLCSKEVAYGHKCFTCEEVICTFPLCSTAYEANDLALPVYFCKKLKKDEKLSCSGVGKKLCSIFIVEQKFNILNELRGCNNLCTC